jgi:hypothetical protein
MGRPGVSKTEVVQAYVALLKQKREPSLLNLRLQLGRGSYSTIGAHVASLKLWRPGKAERGEVRSRNASARPPNVPARIL